VKPPAVLGCSVIKKEEAKQVFGTEKEDHPGVKLICNQGDVYLAGEVKVFSEGR